jgi:hypothetical protein
MKKEFFRWAILTAFSVLVLGSGLILSLYGAVIMSEDDPYSLLRYALLRFTAIAIAAPALTGLMLFVDFITPGDWMKAIGNDSKASAYVMSAVILVIGAILCWT